MMFSCRHSPYPRSNNLFPLRCGLRGQGRFVLDREDAISGANLWLTQCISIHLLDHSSICLLLSLPLCHSFVVHYPFLSPLGTCCIFINSLATPTLRLWASTARTREGGSGGLADDGGRKRGKSAEASLEFEVMDQRGEALWIGTLLPEISSDPTPAVEFKRSFTVQTVAVKQRGL